MEHKKSENKHKSLYLACQAGGANEVVDRFGSASKEHIVSYIGEDRETGNILKRGLKGISESKVNPEYRRQNLRQQAGFAAETKYSARQNADNIISGSKKRYSRTDDLGHVNDPLFDHVVLDERGVEIIGSGEQMKFVGGSAKECLGLLRSKRYDKYIEANAKITVPSDYYSEIKDRIDEEIAKLSKQLKCAEDKGDIELQVKKNIAITKLNKIKENLRNSGITNKQAMEARLHPLLSTTKEIGKISHKAGLQQAKTGAVISGTLSLIRNIVCLCRDEKTVEEAAKDIILDVAGGSITGYLTAFTGSAIKGVIQNSKDTMVRSLSKTNLPATIVTTSIDVGRSIVGYMRRDISGVECLTELGEKGTSNLSAALFAGIGQAAIPIPIVGAMIGSMMGYLLSSFFYQEALRALKEESTSLENRLVVERECKAAIEMIERYRIEMNEYLDRYFEDLKLAFTTAFSTIDKALSSDNTDEFIRGVNVITLKLGGEVQFTSMVGYDELMKSERPLIL